MSPSPRPSPYRLVTRAVPHLVFWCWNAVFLAVAALGVAPLVTAGLIAEVMGEARIVDLVAAAVLVVLVPLAATALGALALRRDPARLFRLFYAVEAPLFLLALGRLFLVRDLTPGVAYVIAASVLAVSAHVYRLLRGAEETRPAAVLLSLVGDTIGVWVAGYVAAFLFFFAVPISGWAAVTIVRLGWLRAIASVLAQSPESALLVILGGTLLLFSGVVFGSLPPVLIALYAHRFRAGARWA
jgi:putative PEP-CTERM system integral membrane protein